MEWTFAHTVWTAIVVGIVLGILNNIAAGKQQRRREAEEQRRHDELIAAMREKREP